MAGTYVYVDGFNLYHRALKGSPFKWLDLCAMCDRILGERVELVRYFTARISALPHDPQAPNRQQTLLSVYHADDRMKVHYGSFKPRTKRGELVEPPPPPALATIRVFEEKGSDVNLATFALVDVYEGRASKVVLLTNDSDLAEPARRIRAKRVPVGVIIPRAGLKPNTVPADFYKTVRKSDLRHCQLPDPARNSDGRPVRKPTGW